jgi:hypothetical protein
MRAAPFFKIGVVATELQRQPQRPTILPNINAQTLLPMKPQKLARTENKTLPHLQPAEKDGQVFTVTLERRTLVPPQKLARQLIFAQFLKHALLITVSETKHHQASQTKNIP